ncbi:MAG: hypothetical protein ACLGIR_11460 [Actinomycetes bacterium]
MAVLLALITAALAVAHAAAARQEARVRVHVRFLARLTSPAAADGPPGRPSAAARCVPSDRVRHSLCVSAEAELAPCCAEVVRLERPGRPGPAGTTWRPSGDELAVQAGADPTTVRELRSALADGAVTAPVRWDGGRSLGVVLTDPDTEGPSFLVVRSDPGRRPIGRAARRTAVSLAEVAAPRLAAAERAEVERAVVEALHDLADDRHLVRERAARIAAAAAAAHTTVTRLLDPAEPDPPRRTRLLFAQLAALRELADDVAAPAREHPAAPAGARRSPDDGRTS